MPEDESISESPEVGHVEYSEETIAPDSEEPISVDYPNESCDVDFDGSGIKECYCPKNSYIDPDAIKALRGAFLAGIEHKEEGVQVRYIEGVPHVFTRDNDEWRVSNESQLLKFPERQTGSIGNFTDHVSFALHFNQQSNAYSRIYLDDQANPVEARAIFDENPEANDPRWREQYSTLTLALDEQWKEWTALISKTSGVSQRDFAEFLEDNQRTISTEYQGHLIESTKIFTATKQVEYVGATDLENGDVQFKYNEVTMAASAGKGGTVEVPRKFTIEIPVFKGSVPYKLECRLRYRVASDGLKFFVKIPSLQKAFDDAVKDVRTVIEETTGIAVFIGTP